MLNIKSITLTHKFIHNTILLDLDINFKVSIVDLLTRKYSYLTHYLGYNLLYIYYYGDEYFFLTIITKNTRSPVA